jgi:hypothetical protein
MARFSGTVCSRKGASARISSIDSRANGTLFVTCAPVDVAGPDPVGSADTATARRIRMAGTLQRRKRPVTRFS